MDLIIAPKMYLLRVGDFFKTLEVTGTAGMIMPPHHATKEAVIVVQEGRAFLKMPTTVHVLQKGMSFTIPAHATHSLEVKEEFKAIVIMGMDSEIEFE